MNRCDKIFHCPFSSQNGMDTHIQLYNFIFLWKTGSTFCIRSLLIPLRGRCFLCKGDNSHENNLSLWCKIQFLSLLSDSELAIPVLFREAVNTAQALQNTLRAILNLSSVSVKFCVQSYQQKSQSEELSVFLNSTEV